ncbi:MAG: YifB family Mg chelatase-like AAA ATPase [Solirubrobacteraceae bacterium]
MLARVPTFTIDGLRPHRVAVEVDIHAGLPAFRIVGLADAAVREARERVRAAVQNSGFEFPQRRITANLAPAHLRKVGPGFDLAIAVGILAASGQAPAAALERWAVHAELSLGGELRPCHGSLAVAEGVARVGVQGLVVATERAGEAALVEGVRIAPVASLREAVELLDCAEPAAVVARPAPERGDVPDLADVRGQPTALLGLEVAAAGGHNVLLEGPPGSGKTMLARRLPGILPPLTPPEALEVTRIHSIRGLHLGGLAVERPFRAPHHSISASGLVGGGSFPVPGEASLAHHGVLFLDELSEFSRSALEALRAPLEDGRVAVVRGQHAAVFPTAVTLVAATNPCACGFAPTSRCTCSEADLARHQRRLSGPLLDRIDLRVDVGRPSARDLRDPPAVTSRAVRERVVVARARQTARLAGTGATCNARLTARHIGDLARMDDAAQRALDAAYERDALSARGRHRVVRVARTIADLAGAERIERGHVLQALTLRQRSVHDVEAA